MNTRITYPKIYYRKGFKYQLEREYLIATDITGHYVKHDFFTLYDNGMLRIHKGYSWDGASGPAFDTKSFMRGSLVHDVFYQAMAEGYLPLGIKKLADQLLRDLCREDGMSALRAWWVYKAVRLNPRPDDNPILEAP